VEAVVRAGLLSGVGGGKLGTNSTVVRQELAVWLAGALHLPPAPPGAADPFADQASPWAQDAIWALVDAGILPGGGTFRPTEEITRADFAAFVVRALLPPAGTAAAGATPG
jgi:hypothetical protein